MSADIFDLNRIDRFYFPTPVVDGARNRKIMFVGLKIDGIETGSAGNNNTDPRNFLLNDGIGGESGKHLC